MGIKDRNPQARYKIKLNSGRILGPLDLEKVHLLIKKKQITGVEIAREYPQGEWKDINQIAEIAHLLMAGFEQKSNSTQNISSTQKIRSRVDPVGPTEVLPGAREVLDQNKWVPLE